MARVLTPQQREQARYQDFQEYEYRKRLFDELTDQSERLKDAPIENAFSYELDSDGRLRPGN